MKVCLPHVLLLSMAFAGANVLLAQSPQAAPASDSTPKPTENPPGNPPHQASSAKSSDGTDPARKDPPRDEKQADMGKTDGGGGNLNASGSGDSGLNFTPGSDAGLGTGWGSNYGVDDFNGGIRNGLSGSTRSRFSGGAGSGFGAGMGTGFRGASGGSGNYGEGFNGFNLGSFPPLTGDPGRGPGVGGHGNAAGAIGAVPSFNQLFRGNLSLPVNSSFGNFRLSYQDPLSLSNSFQMRGLNGYGSGFATYDSPHARSGRIDFSASAKVGMSSGYGSSGYGMGNFGSGGTNAPGSHGPGGNPAGQPSSAVSLHLTF
jgi:hypothetical protein